MHTALCLCVVLFSNFFCVLAEVESGTAGSSIAFTDTAVIDVITGQLMSSTATTDMRAGDAINCKEDRNNPKCCGLESWMPCIDGHGCSIACQKRIFLTRLDMLYSKFPVMLAAGAAILVVLVALDGIVS
eukprot:gnl/TRDRNA2_/TRDRNA2_189225_c0_seq1.p1 gnl/TRDRNA2_/TRDRNA2_189225_c0~~gnl/TRDRNA2_/TRDRNA2_189225_c0_seq1.p1  ORF type:complete len:130 (-),score=17.07 gnl/TRDRNA2_/TRDRNA2_189225_c0_seq1:259-648(-)